MSEALETFTLQHKAYLKLVLHAAKHPHSSVNGLLVARQNLSIPSNWIVSDAIPLLHQWTNLSPMMEVGLDLARLYADAQGLKIVGLYVARELAEDTTLGAVGQRILETLVEGFPSPFAFVVDASAINRGQPAIKINMLHPPTDRKAQKDGVFTFEDTSSPFRALDAIQEGKWLAQISDFDDHLENAKVDWLENRGVGDVV